MLYLFIFLLLSSILLFICIYFSKNTTIYPNYTTEPSDYEENQNSDEFRTNINPTNNIVINSQQKTEDFNNIVNDSRFETIPIKNEFRNDVNGMYKMIVNPPYINGRFENRKNDRNVVIGLIANYSSSRIEPYYKSLRKSGFEGDIICFTLDNSFNLYTQLIEKYRIIPIIFSNSHPYYLLNNKNFPISEEILKNIPPIPQDFFFYNNLRFFLLNLWMMKYSSLYDYILTTDVRDILFQGNPFDWNYERGIYLTHETKHCKYSESRQCSRCNYNWFLNLNPPQYLLSNTFINSGQVFGSSNEMKIFLKEFTEIMYNLHLKNEIRVDTSEQGILNWYIYTRNEYNFPLYLFEAEHGYARILGLDLESNNDGFEPNENLVIVNEDNTIPPLVHQYLAGLDKGSDRRKKIFEEYVKKYTE